MQSRILYSPDEVRRYNILIAQNSHEQIFADSREGLQAMQEYVEGSDFFNRLICEWYLPPAENVGQGWNYSGFERHRNQFEDLVEVSEGSDNKPQSIFPLPVTVEYDFVAGAEHTSDLRHNESCPARLKGHER